MSTLIKWRTYNVYVSDEEGGISGTVFFPNSIYLICHLHVISSKHVLPTHDLYEEKGKLEGKKKYKPEGTRLIWLDFIQSHTNELLLKIQILAPIITLVTFHTSY